MKNHLQRFIALTAALLILLVSTAYAAPAATASAAPSARPRASGTPVPSVSPTPTGAPTPSTNPTPSGPAASNATPKPSDAPDNEPLTLKVDGQTGTILIATVAVPENATAAAAVVFLTGEEDKARSYPMERTDKDWVASVDIRDFDGTYGVYEVRITDPGTPDKEQAWITGSVQVGPQGTATSTAQPTSMAQQFYRITLSGVELPGNPDVWFLVRGPKETTSRRYNAQLEDGKYWALMPIAAHKQAGTYQYAAVCGAPGAYMRVLKHGTFMVAGTRNCSLAFENIDTAKGTFTMRAKADASAGIRSLLVGLWNGQEQNKVVWHRMTQDGDTWKADFDLFRDLEGRSGKYYGYLHATLKNGIQMLAAHAVQDIVHDIQPVNMRGVWVSSVYNLDFPSEDSMGNPQAQQAEIIRIMDNAASWNLDTVFLQVRPTDDALYRSSINPWSYYLTGTQGKDPGWDPLAFAIEQAHARGIALHAWLNPYRVTASGGGFTTHDLAPNSFARQHPDMLISYGGTVQYDPGREEVKQHIVDTVKEIVNNYDVDGIHFDDYFYPAEYPLPHGEGRDGAVASQRRAHVNDVVRRVNDVCKSASHRVIFGISPFGVWKNSSSDPNGSNTASAESYYDLSADSLTWIREGIIDYIAPQLYWPIGHSEADYRTLLYWWQRQTAGTGVSLIIGQGISENRVAADIHNELALNKTVPQVTGSIFYDYSTLANNPRIAQIVRSHFAS